MCGVGGMCEKEACERSAGRGMRVYEGRDVKRSCGSGQRWSVQRPPTHVGSLTKLRKRQTFSIEPFSSKSCSKKQAASLFT